MRLTLQLNGNINLEYISGASQHLESVSPRQSLLEVTGISDLRTNSRGLSMAHHLTESECDLFRRFKLTEEWTDSLEDVVLLSRASSFPAQAQASNSGPSDVMATYLCEEFKTFLEKRGTYKELENVISKVLLKIVQAKKADGSSLFVVKPNSTVEIPTEIVTSPVWKSKEPSLIARPTLRTESDILQNQQTSSDLQVEQQDEFGCSEDGTRNNIVKCLNKIAFDEFCHVKTNLRADVMVSVGLLLALSL